MTYSKEVCIIVPIYKPTFTDLETISFNRIIKVFCNRKIFLICPKAIENFNSELAKNIDNISVSTFNDKCFDGFKNYNKLLMSYDFYNRFSEYNFILICQLDVFVIKDELKYWLTQRIDNIGAPIFEGFTSPTSVIKKGSNGGFCLRNTKSCMIVLSSIKFRYSKIRSHWQIESIWYRKIFRVIRDGLIFNYKNKYLNPIINEDIFWSIVVPEKFPWFVVSEPEKAKFFAFDANPRLLYQMCNYKYPMAIHAWWKYDKPFVLDIIDKLENV
jgi:hypothetical protein